jgi:hypothetical protein
MMLTMARQLKCRDVDNGTAASASPDDVDNGAAALASPDDVDNGSATLVL